MVKVFYYHFLIIIIIKVVDELEDTMSSGGNVVDFHTCDLFPERWFDLVVVLRTDNTILFDRLTQRFVEGGKKKNISLSLSLYIRLFIFSHLQTIFSLLEDILLVNLTKILNVKSCKLYLRKLENLTNKRSFLNFKVTLFKIWNQMWRQL